MYVTAPLYKKITCPLGCVIKDVMCVTALPECVVTAAHLWLLFMDVMRVSAKICFD